jgi:ferredoxin
MNVRVDAAVCSGCGMCVIVCPEVFRMERRRSKRFAVARVGDVGDAMSEFFRIARTCCVRGAI